MLDGSQQTYPNINLSQRWVNGDDECAEVVLSTPIAPDQMKSIVISDTFGGGLFGDNWDMTSVVLRPLVDGGLGSARPGRTETVHGRRQSLCIPLNTIPVPTGTVDKLILTFHTGGDDLRGGNDNVDVIVLFDDGGSQSLPNANASQNWGNNTDHQVGLDLNRAVDPKTIHEIDLRTTFSGGIGGDNWNMDALTVRATGNGIDETLVTAGPKRFTGDDKTLAIPVP